MLENNGELPKWSSDGTSDQAQRVTCFYHQNAAVKNAINNERVPRDFYKNLVRAAVWRNSNLLVHNEQAKKAASTGTDAAGAWSLEHLLEHRPPSPQPVLKAIKGQYLKNLPAKKARIKGKLDVLQLAPNRAQFKSAGKCLKEELSKDITVA